MRLERGRRFGDVWLGWTLWRLTVQFQNFALDFFSDLGYKNLAMFCNMSRGGVLGALVLLVWGGSAVDAWGQAPTPQAAPVSPSVVLGRLGEHAVTVDEIRTLLGAQSNELKQRILTNPKQLEEIVKNEVERKALLAEARKAGVDKQSDVAYLIRRAQEQAILNAYLAPSKSVPEGFPTDKQVDDYYAKNKERFRIPERVNLSTIFLLLLPGWADDKEIEKKVQAEAASLSARAKAGGDFADLARRHSQDRPTADKGGLVGWVTADQLLSELAQVAFKLKPGDVSDPIQTSFGFQVIRVNDRAPAVQRPLSEVRAEAMALLRQEYINQKEREVIDKVLKQNPVSVDGAILERWRQQDLRPQRP